MQQDGVLEKLDWLRSSRVGFGSSISADDLYHGVGDRIEHDLCETWWFEAIVPEKQLVASFYISARPNLGICSSGSWMWSGMHRTQSSADHLDYQIYLPLPTFEGNRISVPQAGLEIEVIDPLRKNHVVYKSPDGTAEADILFEGLFDPVMRSNGKHFEQAMRGRGTIRIGNETYQVDSFSFRDRSWGEPRPERGLVHPPIGWLCGVLDDGRVAFNLSGSDDPGKGAEWAGAYPLSASDVFYDGWISYDGKVRKVVSMSKSCLLYTSPSPRD